MYDKVHVTVPCGHCSSCIINYQNDWFLRTMAEFKTYKAAGGFVLFPTLTYNNAHLPYFEYKHFKFPCFSVADRQKWLKRLRSRFERKFGYSWSNLNADGKPILSVKALSTCEFGEHYQRPHYHAQVFLPPVCETKFIRVNGKQFPLTDVRYFRNSRDRKNYLDSLDNVVAYKYMKIDNKSSYALLLSIDGHKALPQRVNKSSLAALVKYSWELNLSNKQFNNIKNCDKRKFDHLGFCMWSKKGGPFVESLKSARYSMKYMTKDIFFMKNDKVKPFIDYVNSLKVPSGNDQIDAAHREELALIKELGTSHFPKHLQGINFGASLCDQLSTPDSIIHTLEKGIQFFENDKLQHLPVPRYIRNKVCFDLKRNKEGKKDPALRYLTDVGAMVFAAENKILLVRKETDYIKQSSVIYLSSHLQKHFEDEFVNRFHIGFNTFDIQNRINELMNGASFHDLALYDMYFRDYSLKLRGIPTDLRNYKDLIDNAEGLGQLRINRKRSPLSRALDKFGNELEPLLSYVAPYLSEVDHLFNNLSCFRGFDEVLDIFHFIRCNYDKTSKDFTINQQQATSRLNQFYNPLN